MRVPRDPQNERELAWHEAYWKAREDLARKSRLIAHAVVKLEQGDVSGATLELECANSR